VETSFFPKVLQISLAGFLSFLHFDQNEENLRPEKK
jgi:hypothetical protein